MIDANQGGVVTQVEKGRVLRFHGLTKSVCGKIEAQTGIEIVVHPTRFLDEVDAAADTTFAACEQASGLF
jgi:hypothetical protein